MYRMRYFIDSYAGECLWSDNDEAKKEYGYPVLLKDLNLSSAALNFAEQVVQRAGQINCAEPGVYGVSYSFTDVEMADHSKDVAELLIILRRELGPNFEIIDKSRITI